MSACLLSLAVVSLLLPTAFHASFSNTAMADRTVLKVSRGTSVVLLLVYILYLLFQLKSHAFMYASTPQHIIDEESHPGVLAEFLDRSSSSSSSSSSSDSDSDSSNGSHKTSKRIKRALRRKRRKSTSSKGTGSMPSYSRTPSSGTNPSSTLPPYPQTESPAQITPPPSHELEPVFSGDEADVDGEGRNGLRNPDVLARDFQMEENGSRKSAEKRKKRSRKEKKSKKRQSKDEGKGSHLASPRQPQVGFMPDVQEIPTHAASKRPLNILNGAVTPRPLLSKGLSSRVFPHHEATGRSYPMPAMRQPPMPRTSGHSGLRRTSSMPEMFPATASNSRGPSSSTQPLPHEMTDAPGQGDAEVKDVVEPKTHLSRTSAVILLCCSTALVAICADFLVDSIDYLVESTSVSQAFIGLIILPIVGNAAEHITAVVVASKNKMDLAINVALGSSIQIALFVTPLIVILGWCIDVDMSLYFSLFEVVSLFASAFIVNFLMIDGRSNYLEGVLLIAAYVIIAVAAFFYPACDALGSETC